MTPKKRRHRRIGKPAHRPAPILCFWHRRTGRSGRRRGRSWAGREECTSCFRCPGKWKRKCSRNCANASWFWGSSRQEHCPSTFRRRAYRFRPPAIDPGGFFLPILLSTVSSSHLLPTGCKGSLPPGRWCPAELPPQVNRGMFPHRFQRGISIAGISIARHGTSEVHVVFSPVDSYGLVFPTGTGIAGSLRPSLPDGQPLHDRINTLIANILLIIRTASKFNGWQQFTCDGIDNNNKIICGGESVRRYKHLSL